MLDFRSNWQPEKNGPLSHLNGFHVFPRDKIRKTFMLCITQYLSIKMHFELHSWFA